MRKAVILIFILSSVLVMGSPIFFGLLGDKFEETFVETILIDGLVSMEIINVNGDVKVITDNGTEITIVFDIKVTDESTERAKAFIEEIYPDIQIIDSELRVEVPSISTSSLNKQYYEIDMTITVPQNIEELTLSVVNGNIMVEGFEGSIDGNIVNGNVEGTGLFGNISFETVNGKVMLCDSTTKMLNLSTVNGQINATVTPQERGLIDISLVNGTITLNVPADTAGDVTASRFIGGFDVKNLKNDIKKTGNSSEGAINGGSELTIVLETFMGKINLIGI